MSWWIELLIVLGLTLANGVFAGAEIAIIAVRASRLEELGEAGGAGRALASLRGDPERFLATVQVGITVISATAAAFGGATLAERLGGLLETTGLSRETADQIALVVVIVVVSYLSLVLGELVPKSLALKWSERYALAAARPLVVLSRISSPVVRLLTASSNLILRVFGDRTSFSESQISRDELLGVLEEAAESGEVSKRASDIATRAIDLDELHVASVMTPRAAIVALDLEATIDELVRHLDQSDEERFPVRKGLDDVVGYVTTRDIGRLAAGRVEGGLAAIVRPIHVVPESALALDVLGVLQSKRVPIAVVVDESGGLEGIVDIDDLAEELVGSLLVGEHREEAHVVREPDGSFVVPAAMRIHVANRRLDLDLPISPRWTTIGGLLLAELRAVATPGARVELEDGTTLEVLEASARRAHRIRVRPPARS